MNVLRLGLLGYCLFGILHCASGGAFKSGEMDQPEGGISARDSSKIHPSDVPLRRDSVPATEGERLLSGLVHWKILTDSLTRVIELQSDMLSNDDRMFLSDRLRYVAQTMNRLLTTLSELDSTAMAVEPPYSDTAMSPAINCRRLDSAALYKVGVSGLLDACLDGWENGKGGRQGLDVLEKLIGAEPSPVLQLRAMFALARLRYLAGEQETARAVWRRLNDIGPEVVNLLNTAQQQLQFLQLMDNTLDPATKIQVKELNRKYLEGSTHAEISGQALALLKRIESKDLRKEIKKLVSSAWDRDETEVKQSLVEIRELAAAGQPSEKLLARLSELQARYPGHDGKAYEALRQTIMDSGGATADEQDIKSLDSLFQIGEKLVADRRLLQAFSVFRQLQNTPYGSKSEERIRQLGELYCREKRKQAALQFSLYRKQERDSLKLLILQAAALELDSCLTYFPDLEISAKAGKNRRLIQERLDALVQE